jgi:hypothetical protein
LWSLPGSAALFCLFLENHRVEFTGAFFQAGIQYRDLLGRGQGAARTGSGGCPGQAVIATATGRRTRFAIRTAAALLPGRACLACCGAGCAHGLFHAGHHLLEAGFIAQVGEGLAAGAARFAETGFTAGLGGVARCITGCLFAAGTRRFSLGKFTEVAVGALFACFTLAAGRLAAAGRLGTLARAR